MRILRDPDKRRVLAAVKALAAQGAARWLRRHDGAIELRLLSGETYVLGKTAVTRIL